MLLSRIGGVAVTDWVCPAWISEIDPGYSGSERIASQRYSVGGMILHGSFELDRKQLMIKRCGRRERGYLQNMWIATLYRRSAGIQESR